VRGVPPVTVGGAQLWRSGGMANVWNPTPPPEHLPESVRLALNAAGPAFLVMAANAALMTVGGGADLPVFEAGPPAWAAAVVWIGMLVSLGVARFELGRVDDGETFAIDALLAATMIYPFLAQVFDAHWTAAGALTVLAMAAMAVVSAFPQSRRAAALVLPAIGWLGWSSWLAVADLAMA
jgi:hypothetical protein